MAATPEFVFTAALLYQVAYARAAGRSWRATADEVGAPEGAVRDAARAHPEFPSTYQRAEAEVLAEARAELVLGLRARLRDPDPGEARRASEALARHLAAVSRDQTRLKVEEVRAEVARARLEAKRAKDQAREELEEPAEVPAWDRPPEELHRPESEERIARRAADDKAVVWLWGGQHRLGDTRPDPASDVPLVLVEDHTVPGRLFWAARYPLTTDPLRGPFPAPPEEPPPELTPDATAQLAAVAATQGCLSNRP